MVLQATNGCEAIEVYEKNLEKIDMILTDVLMPKMSGPDCIDAIRKKSPDVRVLFMSGHAERVGSDNGQSSLQPLLEKPFSREELAVCVRKVLDAKG